MKNQYVGDIKDYYKYGLLRLLTRDSDIKTAVCWMLTRPENKSEGMDVKYLVADIFTEIKPVYDDPVLLPILRRIVPFGLKLEIKGEQNKSVRMEKIHELIKKCNVSTIENSGILPKCTFNSNDPDSPQRDGYYLEDKNPVERGRYFQRFKEISQGSDLVFFDPDNGLEVKSVKFGRNKGDSKFLYIKEIQAYFPRSSVLIFQFVSVRAPLSINKLDQLKQKFDIKKLYLFKSPSVVFILMTPPPHNSVLDERARKFKESEWHKKKEFVMEVSNG